MFGESETERGKFDEQSNTNDEQTVVAVRPRVAESSLSVKAARIRGWLAHCRILDAVVVYM